MGLTNANSQFKNLLEKKFGTARREECPAYISD